MASGRRAAARTSPPICAAVRTLAGRTIGLSVMATQASAITFLSTPGQAYESGLGFVQNYFGLPLALIIVAAVFLPDLPPAECLHGLRIPRAPVRFEDAPARRGAVPAAARARRRHHDLRPGHHPLDRARLAAGCDHRPHGLFVIVYTVAGGNEAVTLTQKYQMARDLRRHGRGVRRAAGEAARRARADRRAHRGRRASASCRRWISPSMSTSATPFWSGLLGGVVPVALVFRHRPVAGPALPLRRLAAREPARPDVQRGPARSRCSSSSCCSARWSSSSTSSSRRRSSSTKPPGPPRRTSAGARLRALEADFAAAHAEKQRVDPRLARRPARRQSRRPATARAAAWRRRTRSEALRAEAREALHAGRPATSTERCRLCFHHLRARPPAARHHRPAVALIFAAALSSLGLRTQRAGRDHHCRFLPACARRDASDAHYVARLQVVHRLLGPGRHRLRPVRPPGGEPHPGHQHSRLRLLRRDARPFPRGVFSAARRRHRGVLGGAGGPGAGVRPLFHAQHRLPLV